MMKKSDLLKQTRAAKIARMEAIAATDGGLTAELRTEFDALEAEAQALDADIARMEGIESRAAMSVAFTQGDNAPVQGGEQREAERLVQRYSLRKAIRSQLAGGKLDGLELEMHQEAVKESRDLPGAGMGIGVPMMFRGNLAVANTGGNLVPTEQRGFIGALQPRLLTEELGATMLTGLQGNVELPGVDTAASATWEGETDDAADAGVTMRKITLSPNRLAAFQNVALMLLTQNSVSAEAEVRRLIERSIANKVDLAIEKRIFYAQMFDIGVNIFATQWAFCKT